MIAELRNQASRVRFLTQLLTLCLPLSALLRLPITGAKIQPPELIFPVLLATVLLHQPTRHLRAAARMGTTAGPVRWFWGGLLAYTAVLSVSAVRAGDLDGGLEAVGRWYLIGLTLYFAVYAYLHGERGVHQVLKAWMLGTLLLVISAYAGLFLAYTGSPNFLVDLHQDYPYFGTLYRARGLSTGPTHYILATILPVCYAWQRWRAGRGSGYGWWLLIVLPALALSFSKELLLLAIALFLSGATGWSGRRWLRLIVAVGGTLLFWAGTHLMVQPAGVTALAYPNGSPHFSGRVLWSGGGFDLLESAYLTIKRGLWRVFLDNPWVGVGPDQWRAQIPALRESGLYPAAFPDYNPHATWHGALAETGVFGFAGVVIAATSLWARARVQWKLNKQSAAARSIVAYLFVMFITAMCIDTLHLRYLWVPAGLLLGLSVTSDSRLPA